MRLTIIPSDGSVGKDGKFYNFLDLSSCNIPNNVHALQWYDTNGWIEFNDVSPNEEITALPDWTNCCMAKWDEANTPKPPTAEQNKQVAVGLLQQTDWATIPDVSDPIKSDPYLGNSQDFVVYRNVIRQYAINPVAGYIDWPIPPQAVWEKTP